MGFQDCWERVRQETPLKKQTELAEFLDIGDTSISGAKFRDTFPTDWAFRIGRYYKINTDWILTGDGEIKAAPVVQEGGKLKYGRGEKEVETSATGMGESKDLTTEDQRAHQHLDNILRFGNAYQRGTAKGYLSELSTEITDQIKGDQDNKNVS
jgi:hypothetical protein